MNLAIPEPVSFTQPNLTWKEGHDPLQVDNIDVIDPKRGEYIEQLKSVTKLVEITVAIDEDGREVLEAWFEGKNRPYGVGDRLTNTRFVIAGIHKNEPVETSTGRRHRSWIDFSGDTGGTFRIWLEE